MPEDETPKRMIRMEDGTIFYDDMTWNDIKLYGMIIELGTKLVMQQQEISRLRDELADLRDVQQHQPQQIIEALTHLVEQIKTPDQTILGLEALVHKALSQRENNAISTPVNYDNFTPQDFTPQEQKKSKRKGVKQSVKSGVKNAVKQKPTREKILQFYSQIGSESLRKAGKYFDVSHQTIKNILEGS